MSESSVDVCLARAPTVHEALDCIARVELKRPLPCLAIVVHGVNDVGVAYQAHEAGLCAGLNARLNRSSSTELSGGDLRPADYRLDYVDAVNKADAQDPRLAARLRADPDATMFRRAGSLEAEGVYSPVIPFYWGYREESGRGKDGLPHIDTDQWHGQWLDRYRNRLDKNGAFNGGPFANATTTLPDFWREGLDPFIAAFLDRLGGDALRPLRGTPPRHYFVLAALRLAMLIELVRTGPHTKDAAINVIAHSQGCLITLLAQAILAERGARAADCIVMQHPPYSLREPWVEAVGLGPSVQQTTLARVRTFVDIVNFVSKSARSAPAFELSELAEFSCGKGIVGKYWQPSEGACKVVPGAGGVHFAERDNRGKVYLYFSPEDLTVSLRNVQGIGCSGVPDKVSTRANAGGNVGAHEDDGASRGGESLSLLPDLERNGFRQRVFAGPRDGQPPVVVGEKADAEYRIPGLREWSHYAARTLPSGEPRRINGEALLPPCATVFGADQLPVDVIEASIALTSRKGSGFRREDTPIEVEDTRSADRRGWPLNEVEVTRFKAEVQAMLDDQAKQAHGAEHLGDHRSEVIDVSARDGKIVARRWEAPFKSRDRLVREQPLPNENSYHSLIPSAALHHERVTAYDLAIGKPISPDAEYSGWMDYLRAVADWRTDWDALTRSAHSPAKSARQRAAIKLALEHRGTEHPAGAKKLIAATAHYHQSGVLPSQVFELAQIGLVTSQTARGRSDGRPPEKPFRPSRGRS